MFVWYTVKSMYGKVWCNALMV